MREQPSLTRAWIRAKAKALYSLVYIVSFKLLQVSIQVTKPDYEADEEQRHDAQNHAEAEKHVIKRIYRDFLK